VHNRISREVLRRKLRDFFVAVATRLRIVDLLIISTPEFIMSRPPKKFQQFMKKRGNKIFNKGLDSKIFFYLYCVPESAYKHIRSMTDPVDIFKALGDETRLRLVNLFLQTEEDLCVCEMVDALELPQYQISKHLTILKNAGLLQGSREGTWVYYRLDREAPFLCDLFKMLSRHLKQPAFVEDAAKVKQRLALREKGRCVVGFVAAAQITKTLRQKRKRRNHEPKTARHFHLHA
jgi:ArsR family transcriptional regulator